MSALDALVKHHLENTCKETDEQNCVFVQDLISLRADNARLTKERDALREQVRTARELLTTLEWNDWSAQVDAWIAANATKQTPESDRTS